MIGIYTSTTGLQDSRRQPYCTVYNHRRSVNSVQKEGQRSSLLFGGKNLFNPLPRQLFGTLISGLHSYALTAGWLSNLSAFCVRQLTILWSLFSNRAMRIQQNRFEVEEIRLELESICTQKHISCLVSTVSYPFPVHDNFSVLLLVGSPVLSILNAV